jgi:gamma-glutamylcyclotransferase (GGCT)/AIG2-like uncharacterized protein YtfP
MDALFTYGTLMRGQPRAHFIARANPIRIVPATAPGRLVDLGEFPGLVPPRMPRHRVTGEYVEFDPASGLLARLDAIEEYLPANERASLYIRRRIEVTLQDATTAAAWAYIYNRPYDPRRIIKSGDWRNP